MALLGAGPARAWDELCDAGIVSPVELVQDGQVVTEIRRKAATAAWALGRYC